MSRKRLGAVAAAVLVAAGGTGTAIAVTRSDEGTKVEDAVIAGAAERLDVTPEKLRDALSAARDEQLDAQVRAGRLTQEQADRIKARRKQSGRVLGLAGPGPRGGPDGPGRRFGGPGFHGRMGVRAIAVQELTRALGVTRPELGEALRDGKSIADIARAEGRSLDAVKSDLQAAAKKHVDEAVADRKLTQAQRDRILARLNRMIDRLDKLPNFGRRGPHGPGPGGP